MRGRLHTKTLAAAVCAMATALGGCASGDELGPDVERPLVDNTSWALDIDPGHDTHPDHSPASRECNPNAVIVEDGVLELNTRLCHYFVVSQPSQGPVMAGDDLLLEWSHLDLDAAAPAEAHLALSIDGEPQWETHVAIPNDPHAYDAMWTAQRDYPAGSRVTLHLHNHGFNNWALHGLTRLAP